MEIISRYLGGRAFESDIRGHKLIVDTPVGSAGADAGPQPPELVATALGTCVGIYAAAFCDKHGLSAAGMVIHTDWEKVSDPVRIGRMTVRIELPGGIPAEKLEAFMRTVQACMVHNTLCQIPDIALSLHGA